MSKLDFIRELQDKLETERDQYLRESGWEHTCNHPGGYWLWEKVIKGVQYRCSERTAFDLQSASEE